MVQVTGKNAMVPLSDARIVASLRVHPIPRCFTRPGWLVSLDLPPACSSPALSRSLT